MASSTVGVENLLTVADVGGESGLDGKSESDGSSGGDLQIDKEKRGHGQKEEFHKKAKIYYTERVTGRGGAEPTTEPVQSMRQTRALATPFLRSFDFLTFAKSAFSTEKAEAVAMMVAKTASFMMVR